MRRVTLPLVVAALLAVAAGPSVTLKHKGGGGGGCSTQTEFATQLSEDGGSFGIDTDSTYGNSFTAACGGPSTCSLYSATVKVTTFNTTPVTGKLRVGTAADLTTYLGGEATAVISGSGEVTFTFPAGNRPTVTSGNTYYFGVAQSDGYNWRFSIATNSAGGYADGSLWRGSSTQWIMTTNDSGEDIYLRISRCD